MFAVSLVGNCTSRWSVQIASTDAGSVAHFHDGLPTRSVVDEASVRVIAEERLEPAAVHQSVGAADCGEPGRGFREFRGSGVLAWSAYCDTWTDGAMS